MNEDSTNQRLTLGWLLELYIHPKRAMNQRVLNMRRSTQFAFIWIVGMASVSNRLDFTLSMKDSPSATDPDWMQYFWQVIFGGLFAGFILVAIGSVWFHIRVLLSGGRGFTWSDSRRVFFSAGLIWSLPLLLAAITYSQLYDTPFEASHEVIWLILGVTSLMPVWSVWTSYRGARDLLGAKRGRGAFWLLGVPWATLLALGTIIFIAALMEKAPYPDYSQTHRFRTEAIQNSQIPGNWVATFDSDNWIPSFGLVADGPDGEAFFRATMFYSSLSTEELLAEHAADVENIGHMILHRKDFATWADHTGMGYRLHTTFDKLEFSLTNFLYEIDKGTYVQVESIRPKAWEDTKRDATDFIFRSLNFIKPVDQKPDLLTAPTWRTRLFTIKTPGNWIRTPTDESEGFGPALDTLSPQGSSHSVFAYPSELSPESEVFASITDIGADADETTLIETLKNYGDLPCFGQSVKLEFDGTELKLNVYVIPLNRDLMLEINEFIYSDHELIVKRGFDLLRDSLHLQNGIEVDDTRLPGSSQEGETRGNPPPGF